MGPLSRGSLLLALGLLCVISLIQSEPGISGVRARVLRRRDTGANDSSKDRHERGAKTETLKKSLEGEEKNATKDTDDKEPAAVSSRLGPIPEVEGAYAGAEASADDAGDSRASLLSRIFSNFGLHGKLDLSSRPELSVGLNLNGGVKGGEESLEDKWKNRYKIGSHRFNISYLDHLKDVRRAVDEASSRTLFTERWGNWVGSTTSEREGLEIVMSVKDMSELRFTTTFAMHKVENSIEDAYKVLLRFLNKKDANFEEKYPLKPDQPATTTKAPTTAKPAKDMHTLNKTSVAILADIAKIKAELEKNKYATNLNDTESQLLKDLDGGKKQFGTSEEALEAVAKIERIRRKLKETADLHKPTNLIKLGALVGALLRLKANLEDANIPDALTAAENKTLDMVYDRKAKKAKVPDFKTKKDLEDIEKKVYDLIQKLYKLQPTTTTTKKPKPRKLTTRKATTKKPTTKKPTTKKPTTKKPTTTTTTTTTSTTSAKPTEPPIVETSEGKFKYSYEVFEKILSIVRFYRKRPALKKSNKLDKDDKALLADLEKRYNKKEDLQENNYQHKEFDSMEEIEDFIKQIDKIRKVFIAVRKKERLGSSTAKPEVVAEETTNTTTTTVTTTTTTGYSLSRKTKEEISTMAVVLITLDLKAIPYKDKLTKPQREALNKVLDTKTKNLKKTTFMSEAERDEVAKIIPKLHKRLDEILTEHSKTTTPRPNEKISLNSTMMEKVTKLFKVFQILEKNNVKYDLSKEEQKTMKELIDTKKKQITFPEFDTVKELNRFIDIVLAVEKKMVKLRETVHEDKKLKPSLALNQTAIHNISRILNVRIILDEDGGISKANLTKEEEALFNKVVDLKKSSITLPTFKSQAELDKFVRTFKRISEKFQRLADQYDPSLIEKIAEVHSSTSYHHKKSGHKKRQEEAASESHSSSSSSRTGDQALDEDGPRAGDKKTDKTGPADSDEDSRPRLSFEGGFSGGFQTTF